jgi:hypothetical protein
MKLYEIKSRNYKWKDFCINNRDKSREIESIVADCNKLIDLKIPII